MVERTSCLAPSLAAFCVSLLSACSQDAVVNAPRPMAAWFGEHLAIGTDGVTACGGSFEAMDRHADLVGKELMAEEGFELDVYVLPPNFDFADGPCEDSACSYESEIWTTYLPASHEIVHGVRSNAVGWSAVREAPSVLEEGLAEVYGDDVSTVAPTAMLAPVEDVLDGDVVGLAEYQRAGHFVRYLLERYSLDEVMDLASAGRSVTLEAAFEEVLGESLTRVLADYAQYPICSRNDWRIPILECAGERTPWIAEAPRRVSWTFLVSCDDDDVIGPRFGRVYTTEVLNLATPGRFRFETDFFDLSRAINLFEIKLVRCDTACDRPSEIVLRNDQWASTQIDLEAGTYYVEFDRLADANDLPAITVELAELSQ